MFRIEKIQDSVNSPRLLEPDASCQLLDGSLLFAGSHAVHRVLRDGDGDGWAGGVETVMVDFSRRQLLVSDERGQRTAAVSRSVSKRALSLLRLQCIADIVERLNTLSLILHDTCNVCYACFQVHAGPGGVPTTIFAGGKPEISQIPAYGLYYGMPIYDIQIPLSPVNCDFHAHTRKNEISSRPSRKSSIHTSACTYEITQKNDSANSTESQ